MTGRSFPDYQTNLHSHFAPSSKDASGRPFETKPFWEIELKEKLVDVKARHGTVIHTYPVTLPAPDDADDTKFEVKALEAAAFGQLVPSLELETLTASLHVSRRGRMEPYSDDLAVNSDTKVGLEQVVRERAHLLWEREGSPAGRAEEYWHRAHAHHRRERAYLLWEQAGSPEGCADEHWRRVCDFEAC